MSCCSCSSPLQAGLQSHCTCPDMLDNKIINGSKTPILCITIAGYKRRTSLYIGRHFAPRLHRFDTSNQANLLIVHVHTGDWDFDLEPPPPLSPSPPLPLLTKDLSHFTPEKNSQNSPTILHTYFPLASPVTSDKSLKNNLMLDHVILNFWPSPTYMYNVCTYIHT